MNVSSNKRKYKFASHDDTDIYATINPPSVSISESLPSNTVRASDHSDMMLNLLIQAFSCLSIKYNDIIDEDIEMTKAGPLDEDIEMTEAEPYYEADDVEKAEATVLLS